ncbi:HVA22-like protein f [Momordica charantia]|uniref:HVA22-like protein n=1 Tax=Momordica charantia TaxID=3673 RepID=A0A6J1D1X5_MOMCH|nr:HVA22-like protein f [Momordica charantia]
MGFLGFRATFNILHVATGFAIMLLYPLYASTRALEKPSSRDHQQWLTYWVLLSFLTLFELYFSSITSWIPLWPYVKLVFFMWLVLPNFKGSAYVYENIVMKFLNIESTERANYDLKEEEKKEDKNEDEYEKEEEDEDEDEEEEDEEKKIFHAWKLVDDYIDKNGADALEEIVKSALQASGTNKQKQI